MDIKEFTFPLHISFTGKTRNCYETVERFNQTPAISGIYIFKKNILGELPREMKLKVKLSLDKSDNIKLIVSFVNSINKSVKNEIEKIIEEEKSIIYLRTVISYHKLMKKQVYRQYNGAKINNRRYIKNVLIHRDYLHENYPEYMIVELSWEYIDNGVNKNKTPIFPNL